MDIQWIIDQIKTIIDPWDIVAVVAVFITTAKTKVMFPKRWRPVLAFGYGMLVAIFMWIAGIIYMWNHVLFYGFIYGAAASFSRNFWKYTIKDER